MLRGKDLCTRQSRLLHRQLHLVSCIETTKAHCFVSDGSTLANNEKNPVSFHGILLKKCQEMQCIARCQLNWQDPPAVHCILLGSFYVPWLFLHTLALSNFGGPEAIFLVYQRAAQSGKRIITKNDQCTRSLLCMPVCKNDCVNCFVWLYQPVQHVFRISIIFLEHFCSIYFQSTFEPNLQLVAYLERRSS